MEKVHGDLGLIIRFSNTREFGSFPISSSVYRAIDSWINFVMQNDVQKFGLDFYSNGGYEFPTIEKLLLRLPEVKSPFHSLRSIRLVSIDIRDEVVHYFLASCLRLEQLCIKDSYVTKNLQVVDPPKLKILEISNCIKIQSLEISTTNLVSLTYEGKKNILLLKKIPNLCELSLGEDFCDSFVFEPNEHSSYSVQLLKLMLNFHYLKKGGTIKAPPDLPQLCSLKRLELCVETVVGRSLLFFTSLIKASPLLCEFKIKIYYHVLICLMIIENLPFPQVSEDDAVKFDHKNLNEVEIDGFIGCSNEEKLVLQLFKIVPSIERVIIDTKSGYYDDPDLVFVLRFLEKYGHSEIVEIGAISRTESKERAERLVSTFTQEIEYIVL